MRLMASLGNASVADPIRLARMVKKIERGYKAPGVETPASQPIYFTIQQAGWGQTRCDASGL